MYLGPKFSGVNLDKKKGYLAWFTMGVLSYIVLVLSQVLAAPLILIELHHLYRCLLPKAGLHGFRLPVYRFYGNMGGEVSFP